MSVINNLKAHEAQAVSIVKAFQASLTDEQRLELWKDIQDGYCQHCGRDDTDTKFGCQCWNDE